MPAENSMNNYCRESVAYLKREHIYFASFLVTILLRTASFVTIKHKYTKFCSSGTLRLRETIAPRGHGVSTHYTSRLHSRNFIKYFSVPAQRLDNFTAIWIVSTTHLKTMITFGKVLFLYIVSIFRKNNLQSGRAEYMN